jgi:hypothetical protein
VLHDVTDERRAEQAALRPRLREPEPDEFGQVPVAYLGPERPLRSARDERIDDFEARRRRGDGEDTEERGGAEASDPVARARQN